MGILQLVLHCSCVAVTGLGKQGLKDVLGFNKAAAFDRVAFMSVDFVMLEGFMSTLLQRSGPSKLASLLVCFHRQDAIRAGFDLLN